MPVSDAIEDFARVLYGLYETLAVEIGDCVPPL